MIKAPDRMGMNPSVELRPGVYNALGEVEGARLQADALRRRARRSAGVSYTAVQKVPEISTSSTSPAGSSARRSTWSNARLSISWCRRKPRS